MNSSKFFCKETYLPASSVYYLICIVGKEIALCGKAVSLNSSRLLMGFVKVGFYHLYCLLCMWTLCWAHSKVAFLVALLVTNILAQRYADDITLLAPTFASLKSMIKICEIFGKEFDLTFNASKTVCIYFPGKRRYRENPPTLYMNDKALSWVKSVKHLGNIVTWDLIEAEEISKKRCDFIGGTISLLANFKSI